MVMMSGNVISKLQETHPKELPNEGNDRTCHLVARWLEDMNRRRNTGNVELVLVEEMEN